MRTPNFSLTPRLAFSPSVIIDIDVQRFSSHAGSVRPQEPWLNRKGLSTVIRVAVKFDRDLQRHVKENPKSSLPIERKEWRGFGAGAAAVSFCTCFQGCLAPPPRLPPPIIPNALDRLKSAIIYASVHPSCRLQNNNNGSGHFLLRFRGQ